MFGTVFILHMFQNDLLVLGCIRCLVLRINIHSVVPPSKRSEPPQRIEHMCRSVQHACQRSHFSIIFTQHLSSKPHREEQVFHPLSLLLGQSVQHAIHVIENVIVHCGNVTDCDCMPILHPQSPISEWPLHFHNILHKWSIQLELWKVSTSATTLVSVRNTRVFRTALTALTEPCALWRSITRYPSPRRRVVLHTYSFTLW